ncbi:hypothetical protein BZA05DRAFT_349661 [Tricharina praecox]|uniref:uncharacterized protein n=1 Tax=Tricharina praecox TaxID=43433 RepID=UPI00221EF989|nr:uncharacterized protein BZA05DRAFT_349661 [Tricharina praecox]KAI5856061.1 hypothetical protein BZA05DRAFT_349661 [Tricharina praecox]
MVAGRKPASTWQAVAAKVVSGNRIRRGLGKDVRIQDFRVEELGGRAGKSVFGPVSVFNGAVSFRVKKPLKGITVTVAFAGVTEVEGSFVSFLSERLDVFSGGDFQAKLAVDDRPDSRETLPFSHNTEIMEYRTKPLRISFIPYVDSSLETPLVSRKPSMRKRHSENGSGKRESRLSAHTIFPPGTPGLGSGVSGTSGASGQTTPKMRGPKLTLTTADLPGSPSSSSTPLIDRPHPAALSSAIERSTRVTDEAENTIAKLTVEMPASRFLPGDNIVMKLTLQIRSGVPIPKGLGARVIETRSLAIEGDAPTQEIDADDDDDEEAGRDPVHMIVVGKEQLRVLTGKKFLLHPNEVHPIQQAQEMKLSERDTGLAGGLEMIKSMTVTLPPFRTFISDSLLPTATLPLGDPHSTTTTTADNSTDNSPFLTPATTRDKGKGKGKEKCPLPSITPTPTSTSPDSRDPRDPAALLFRVQHVVQITVPMLSAEAASSRWYSTGTSTSSLKAEDLEVTVPIILGNKDPRTVKTSVAELRLTAAGGGGSGGGVGGAGGGGSGEVTWRGGMKFGTLRDGREGRGRPGFVIDP